MARQGEMNILLVITDQQRADSLGVTGSPATTPNLDALAAEGVVFERAVTNAPTCIPARVSLASGRYPHQHGLWNNGRYDWPRFQQSWMWHVREAGYHTSWIGKTHMGAVSAERLGIEESVFSQGPRELATGAGPVAARWKAAGVFDAYCADVRSRPLAGKPPVRPTPLPVELYYDVLVPELALEHIGRLPTDRPWCTVVSFAGPHEPWDTPEPYASMFDPAIFPRAHDPIEIAPDVDTMLRRRLARRDWLDDELVAQLRGDYAGSVRLIDDQIGRLVDAVESRGELDRTVIVCTSDHGEMNGDHGMIYKSTFLDGAVRIPLLVREPGHRGSTTDALVELIDVGATIADYAGADNPDLSHGRTVRPVIDEPQRAHRSHVVSELMGETMIMSPTHKLTINHRGDDVFLVDTASDAVESTNLLLESSPPKEVNDLRDALLRFRLATHKTIVGPASHQRPDN